MEDILKTKALLTTIETAGVFSIPVGSLRNGMSKGTFPVKPVYVGHKPRFRSSDIIKYIEGLDHVNPNTVSSMQKKAESA